MRIAVFMPYYLPGFRGGGPIRTLAAMVAEHGERHEFRILTPDTDWGQTEPLPVETDRWVRVGRAQVWYVRAAPGSPPNPAPGSPPNPAPGSPSDPTRRSLRRGLAAVRAWRPDVIYLNGVMPLTWSILPLTLTRLGYFGRVPLMIAPRGEFGPGALAAKSGRKRAYFALARLIRLYHPVIWHASTDREAAEIRLAFPGARVVVRENEVLLPARAVPPHEPAKSTPPPPPMAMPPVPKADTPPATPADTPPATPADTPSATPPPLRVVFLSRVSPKKGLHRLIEALALVDPALRITLDVYGAGDRDYIERCRQAADRLPPHVTARFHGEVPPERVAAAFADADVSALPTAHENFGHAIAEALAASCPVLLADVTPWTPWLAAGGGRVVPSLEPPAWADALTEWARAPASERLARRLAAGAAYEAWWADRPRESVFDLAFPDGTTDSRKQNDAQTERPPTTDP